MFTKLSAGKELMVNVFVQNVHQLVVVDKGGCLFLIFIVFLDEIVR